MGKDGCSVAFKTIYLTGAPAAGKSSTTRLLADNISPLEIWEYGARLTAFIQERSNELEDQDDLRSKSGLIVRPEDIDAVDDELLQFIGVNRSSSHIIIDSHPVTKENYGFRIAAFSLERFRRLNPDEIWMLYTPPEVAIERISRDRGGRPMIDVEQARMHTVLQASVAASYGMATGKPVYLFDSNCSQSELVGQLATRLG